MKTISKLAILAMLSVVLASCNKQETVKPTTQTNNGSDTSTGQVTTTPTTNRIRSYNVNGVTKFDICCNPGDLDNSDSLLSERVVLFSYDQSTIKSEYREVIAIHGRYLSQNPNARVILEGHADERGTPEYNLALGEKRGNSVANLLRARGASSGQISVVSYGEEKPAQICSSESCWSQNRRVRIVYTAK